MKSLRTIVTLSASASVIGAVALLGWTVDALVERQMTREFDAVGAMKTQTLGTLLHTSGKTVVLDFAGEAMPEFERPLRPEYFEVWSEDGAVIERSLALHGTDLPRRFGPVDRPAAFALVLADGRPGRASGAEFAVTELDESEEHAGPERLGSAQHAVVVVARERERLDATLHAVHRDVLLACLGATLFALFATAWLTRRALAPLIGLARRVEGMDATRLDQRLTRSDLPSELAPICERLDALFGRVQAAFERERRLTANVAHELRTPLAELRAASDIAVRWPDDPALVRKAVAAANDVAVRMGAIVEALQKLARLEAHQEELETAEVELREVVQEAWRPQSARAAERGVDLTLEIAAELEAVTDRSLLQLIVNTIVDNAVAHSESPGPLRVTATADRDTIRLAFRNRAPKLERSDLARLDEPFWRKDGARGSGGHSGLGLALAGAVARALGARIEFELVEGDLVVTLVLPEMLRP